MYLDDALAGAERQTYETRPVNGHDLVSDIEATGLLSRAGVHQAGDDDGGEDGTPARLHYHHAQDLSFLLLDVNLSGHKLHLKNQDLRQCEPPEGKQTEQAEWKNNGTGLIMLKH